MKRFKHIKLIIIMLIAVAVCGLCGVLYSLYHESPPTYRPMVFYDGRLFWTEKIIDTDIENLQYIGTVNSCVSESQKPDSEFECNTKTFMNAELFSDSNGNYYIRCTNQKLLLLDC